MNRFIFNLFVLALFLVGWYQWKPVLMWLMVFVWIVEWWMWLIGKAELREKHRDGEQRRTIRPPTSWPAEHKSPLYRVAEHDTGHVECPPVSSGITCGKCGKPMSYNVPSLGPDKGFVHTETGNAFCKETEQNLPPVAVVEVVKEPEMQTFTSYDSPAKPYVFPVKRRGMPVVKSKRRRTKSTKKSSGKRKPSRRKHKHI